MAALSYLTFLGKLRPLKIRRTLPRYKVPRPCNTSAIMVQEKHTTTIPTRLPSLLYWIPRDTCTPYEQIRWANYSTLVSCDQPRFLVCQEIGKSFAEGVTAFRNVRDLACELREQFLASGFEKARFPERKARRIVS